MCDSKKKVHVVAWHYSSGGGFNWYFDSQSADKAYEDEKSNTEKHADEDCTAFRFDTEVSSYESANDEIDAELDELCTEATIKYSPTYRVGESKRTPGVLAIYTGPEIDSGGVYVANIEGDMNMPEVKKLAEHIAYVLNEEVTAD